MQLKFDDDSLQLILNDKLVYERSLNPAGPRTFGLFHYSDQTEANVRNVVLRGDWPRSVPARQQQELATNIAIQLDEDRPRLTTVFRHDFAKRGIDRDYFQLTPGDARLAQTSKGFLAQVNRPGRWMHAGVHTRHALRGDFDIETSSNDLRATGPDHGAVSLAVHFDDEQKHYATIMRAKN